MGYYDICLASLESLHCLKNPFMDAYLHLRMFCHLTFVLRNLLPWQPSEIVPETPKTKNPFISMCTLELSHCFFVNFLSELNYGVDLMITMPLCACMLSMQ